MSNILYRIQVNPQEDVDAVVIDSNEMLESCIEERKRIAKEKERTEFQSFSGEEEYLEEISEDPEFTEFPEEPAEPEVDYVALAKEEADTIVMNARMQADEILSRAEGQAEAMKSHAEAEGQKAGFDQGMQEAYLKQTEMEKEIELLRQSLQEEYKDKQEHLEKDLVDVICGVVEKVFMVQFGDKKELILHLLDNALSNIEGGKEFMIRVNERNAEFLRSQKEELQLKIGQEITLDIVQDPLLDDSQCMIETDGGLFDCSMDTEMRNLIKDIRSLS